MSQSYRANYPKEAFQYIQMITGPINKIDHDPILWILQQFYKENFQFRMDVIGEAGNEPRCYRHLYGHCVSWSDDFTVGPNLLCLRAEKAVYKRRFLWCLMHEYGHLVMENPSTSQSCSVYGSEGSLERESAAWDLGWDKIIVQFPEIRTSKAEYLDRREFNLREYASKGSQ